MDSTTLGWQEWCSFSDLNLPAIKAKIDTGATTSSLHAFNLEPFIDQQKLFIRFHIHPLQHRTDVIRECIAPLLEKRMVTDSGGHKEERYVIRVALQLTGHRFDIDLTLTNRETMKYRMLLGRNALAGRFMVDPEASYLLGKVTRKTLKKLYLHPEA